MIPADYELGEREVVRRYIKDHHRVLEGGAGVGAVTRELSERAEVVVSCEPQYPQYLEAQTNLEDRHNVVLLPLALTARGYHLTLNIDRDWKNTSATSLGWSGQVDDRLSVPSLSGLNALDALGLNALVLDIEGYEYQFLAEMNLDPIELIIFEYHPHKLYTDAHISLFDYLEGEAFDLIEAPQSHPEDDFLYPEPGLICPVFKKAFRRRKSKM